MNVLLIGDPHFKTNNVLETNRFVQETLKYVQENKDNITFIVVLGDVLDTHEKIHMQALCRANNFLLSLASYCYTYVLIGNHDRMNNKIYMTEDHPFTALKNTENIKIIDKTYKNDEFIFVPYVENGRFLEALETVNFNPKDDCKAIFAHQEFKGAQMSNIISEDGDKWPEDYPIVFSGHIHDFQQPQKNILYPGTPYQNSFYESRDKCIILLTFEGNEYSYQKIKLDTIRKKTIKAKVSDLDNIKQEDNTLIEVILEDNLDTIKNILNKETKEMLENRNISIKIKPQNIKINRDQKRSNNFEENLKRNIEKLEENTQDYFYSHISSSSKSLSSL